MNITSADKKKIQDLKNNVEKMRKDIGNISEKHSSNDVEELYEEIEDATSLHDASLASYKNKKS